MKKIFISQDTKKLAQGSSQKEQVNFNSNNIDDFLFSSPSGNYAKTGLERFYEKYPDYDPNQLFIGSMKVQQKSNSFLLPPNK